MPNPIRALRDWNRSRQAVPQLFAAVQRARPSGIEVPRNDPELAAAVQMLLKDAKYGALLTVVKFKQTLMLVFREDADATLEHTFGALTRDVVATPGEDLVNE